MTILNDNQIRSLCLIPTHFWVRNTAVALGSNDSVLSLVNGVYYFTHSGRAVSADILHRRKTEGCDIVPVDDSNRPYWSQPMISPFAPEQVRHTADAASCGVISYGTSSMGYDVRLGTQFKIFTNVFSDVIDPLVMPETMYVDYQGDCVIIPPNSYALGHTVEYFQIPKDIMAICVGKSTYARIGLAVNVTPIECGFEGNVVIELSNQTTLPIKVYANQGIAQFLFFKGEMCATSYADRAGKYQGQTGIQTALV